MAVISVTDFSSFINCQTEAQEKIESYLWQLEALLAVAMIDDFYNLPKNILHNYFSIADDLVEEAIKVNQMSINELLSQDR